MMDDEDDWRTLLLIYCLLCSSDYYLRIFVVEFTIFQSVNALYTYNVGDLAKNSMHIL